MFRLIHLSESMCFSISLNSTLFWGMLLLCAFSLNLIIRGYCGSTFHFKYEFSVMEIQMNFSLRRTSVFQVDLRFMKPITHYAAPKKGLSFFIRLWLIFLGMNDDLNEF